MELFELELQEAEKLVAAMGRSKDDFSFEMSFLPPDPDGGGMFTVRYEVVITAKNTSKSVCVVGGIGLNWVGQFEYALEEKYFDG